VRVVLDDFVQMWGAKERSRDGLVPDSFEDEANRRRLRIAGASRALLIAAVAGAAILLFVASWLPLPVLVAVWVLVGATVIVGLALAAWSLSHLADEERAAALDGERVPDAAHEEGPPPD
jgi:Flp pilus assembly protein TadB